MTSSRTRMSPDARRRQLIDLGVAMAGEQPLESITIESVAEAAGVSKGLIFHYFESKADFHLQVVREQAQIMLDRTMPRQDITDVLEVLRSSVAAYVDYVSDNGRGFIGVIRGATSADPEIRDVADSTRAAMSERILKRAPELGIERSPAIELAVAGWIAFVEETLVRWLADPAVTREQLIAILVAALPLLAGLVGEAAG
ncbi:TetR/AcrR family transcriptional regulator [Gordonia liuliyuniae]|uniref:TetR/AcrR family transcriptional regulator n=1 Tax=Gordonia liuliyuniae TaxID=2911517 RepID=A0ABS9IXR4_9ACTN|nr:TetR/AcrR family transcriptional regulator [Gordonia liuliyuniae]MCF8590245.1 TetR/AcrR family transcriptional regulator [Gordonia liuliyuniae]